MSSKIEVKLYTFYARRMFDVRAASYLGTGILLQYEEGRRTEWPWLWPSDNAI